ncbi:aquaporin [Devosia sp.]|uniref:aquaporin n=1 Tax=Devosia sp. TaxID=1871048 RepID=UPI003F702C89
MTDHLRPLAAEALGTALLVATVVGSGIMADRLTDDGALTLLANTLPTGAMLVVLILTLGPISGAHLNPAVSLVAALGRQLPWGRLAPYVLAQLAGGVTGAILANLMFELQPIALSSTPRSGLGQWLSEIVATCGLLLVIGLGRQGRNDTAWAVGLYITAAYWFTASTSFANPAVTLARALTDSLTGIRPADVLPFVAAQLLGGLLAFALVQCLRARVAP